MLELVSAIILSFGWIWFSVMTGILLILFISSDVAENGYYAAVSFVVYLGFIYFLSNIEWSLYLTWELLYQVLIYLGIGIVYSFIRTVSKVYSLKSEFDKYVSFYVKGIVAENNKRETIEERKNEKLEILKKDAKEEISGSILRWVFIWVISLFVWVFSNNFFILLRDYVKGLLLKFYNSIFEFTFNLVFKEK